MDAGGQRIFCINVFTSILPNDDEDDRENICNDVPPATAADDNPNEDDWQELNQKHEGGPDGFCSQSFFGMLELFDHRVDFLQNYKTMRVVLPSLEWQLSMMH